jgi:TonB family protein
VKAVHRLILAGLASAIGVQSSVAQPESSPPAEAGYLVVVEVQVRPDGSVSDAKVLRSENDLLSRLALATAREWKLPVRQRDGTAVAYRAEAPVFFPVEDDRGAAADAIPKPQPREVVRPEYPRHLRSAGEVGGAIVEFTVDPTGRVRDPVVLRNSHRAFGEAARKAIALWRFYPAEEGGAKVESRVRMAFVFETDRAAAEWRWVVSPRPAIASYVLTVGPE